MNILGTHPWLVVAAALSVGACGANVRPVTVPSTPADEEALTATAAMMVARTTTLFMLFIDFSPDARSAIATQWVLVVTREIKNAARRRPVLGSHWCGFATRSAL